MNKADKKRKERERKEERNKETINIYNSLCHNKVQRQFGMFINSSSTFTF